MLTKEREYRGMRRRRGKGKGEKEREGKEREEKVARKIKKYKPLNNEIVAVSSSSNLSVSPPPAIFLLSN